MTRYALSFIGFHRLRRRRACCRVFLLLALGSPACSAWDARPLPLEQPERLVLFTFTGDAETVCLSGDFNDWAPRSQCLEKRGERWEIRIPLLPGRYRYGFLLDGKEWVPDPDAFLEEEDGFGRKNSVLVVQ